MQFNTYTAAGSLIAADLVNQLAAGRLAADRPALTLLLDRYDVHVTTVTAATAAGIRVWAQRLRPVFETTGLAGKAALTDGLLVAAACRPRLVSHDSLAHHLHYAPLEAGLTARVRGLTASGLAHLIADGAGHRLGCCQRDGCAVVFVDVSRGGRRHFCSVRCANAVNVRLHRARHHPRRPVAGSAVGLPAVGLPAVGPAQPV